MAKKQSTVRYALVPDFPGFRVGTDGSIWSRMGRGGRGLTPLLKTWRRIRRKADTNGYVTVKLHWRGQVLREKLHRLVLLLFVGPCPPDKDEAAHENGVRTDNRLSNLSWKTRLENAADRIRHGNQMHGEGHASAKLTEAIVYRMRQLYAAGIEDSVSLSRLYGVSQYAAYSAVVGKTWRHVKMPRT
jgi:hypothetical protein